MENIFLGDLFMAQLVKLSSEPWLSASLVAMHV